MIARLPILTFVGLFAVAAGFGPVDPVLAQPAAPGAEPQIPEPELVELRTRDGLQLKATFYPGTLQEKSVPVLMLHDFKSSGAAFQPLALALQEQGHAVLVPDLRGHGSSTRFIHPITGAVAELQAANMRKADFLRIVRFDIEALRRFLLERNNEGQVNLNKLCLIGAEMGAMAALNWAAIDWSAPPLPVGKQGQDVKGLVLISPQWSYEGIPVKAALDQPGVRSRVSVLLIAGQRGTGATRDAQRIHDILARFRPDRENTPNQDLYLLTRDTSLQGTQMLSAPDLNLTTPIVQFIKLRVAEQEFPWSERPVLRP
jgi:pimeloyl-ACP methyl ester carboxylesterase